MDKITQLSDADTVVWLGSIKDTNEKFISQLPKTEKNYYSTLKNSKRAKQFLAGRYWARTLLTKHVDNKTSPSNWIFVPNNNGKLYIKNNENIFFNISHSENLIVIAISSKHEVGIDVETFKNRDFSKIAEYAFNKEQQQHLKENKNSKDKEKYFYNIWTKNEATLKAKGLSFRHPKNNPLFNALKTTQLLTDSFAISLAV